LFLFHIFVFLFCTSNEVQNSDASLLSVAQRLYFSVPYSNGIVWLTLFRPPPFFLVVDAVFCYIVTHREGFHLST
jgi:hypothetical protein